MMKKYLHRAVSARFKDAMEREPILKNRVSTRKTTGVGGNFIKRFATAIFCLALALNAFAATSYTITGSGSNLTLTISGTGAMPNYTYFPFSSPETDAPWHSQRANIKTVVINSGVTSIGNYAFWCCFNLSSVTIPNSVTSIGEYAFQRCVNDMTSITIPNSVTSIGEGAFSGSGLTSVTIPNAVTSIGDGAFEGCRGLTDVTVNWATPLSINSNVFQSVSLSNVNLHVPENSCASYKTVSVWQDFGFECSQTPPTVTTLAATNITQTAATLNKSVTAASETITEQGFKYKKPSESSWNTSTSGSLTGLTAGTRYQFYAYATTASGTTDGSTLTFRTTDSDGEMSWETGYPNATDVIATLNLADSTLTVSGNGAMADYKYNDIPWYSQRSNVKTLVINNGVTAIGNFAFYNCSGLTSVTIPNSVTSIGYYAFSGCSGLTSVTIPNSVTSIGESTFLYCTGLTSVTIGNSVTSIGGSAFSDCSGLTSVTIPNSVTSIGGSAFRDCSGLTSVTIGSSVTSIGNAAFSGCSGLTSVTIPNSVKTIDYYAFGNCTGLTEISVAGNNSNYSSDNGVLFNKNKTRLIQFPAGKTGTYNIPNSVTSIGEYAFSGCSGLTSVTIPNSVTSIGDGAFSGSGLTSVTIPNSVTSIGDGAFWNCSSLTSVTIPNSVTAIYGSAFGYCSSLTDVTVNWTTPLSIDSYVFYGVSLSNVNLNVSEKLCALYKAAPVWGNFNVECMQTVIQLGTTYSETVESGSYNRYTFSVTKEGMLTVNISTDGSTAALTYQGTALRLLNSSGETLKTFIAPTGFPYSDEYSTAGIGNYQIEISSEYGGKFNIRVDCFVDETEPNNTIGEAMLLPNSGCTVRGALTSSDVDMYKYVLTQPGRFTVNAALGSSSDGGVSCVYVKWYSSDGTLIKSSSDCTTYSGYMDLEAGTYYTTLGCKLSYHRVEN